jgi:hypothetical protein
MRYKADGNAAFQHGDFTEAIDCYSKAIDEPVHARDVAGEAPRRTTYLLNRAQAYLRRAEAGGVQLADTCAACS